MYPEMFAYRAQDIREDFRRANAGRATKRGHRRMRSLLKRTGGRAL